MVKTMTALLAWLFSKARNQVDLAYLVQLQHVNQPVAWLSLVVIKHHIAQKLIRQTIHHHLQQHTHGLWQLDAQPSR